MNNGLTLQGNSDRVSHNLREKVAKNNRERRTYLLYLIASYLENHGFTRSSDALSAEAQLREDVRVCDNIDLEMILMDFDAYYHLRFNKYPTLCKTIVGSKKSATAQSKHESRNASRCDLETKGADQQMNDFVPQDISLAMTVMPIFGSGGQASTKEAPELSTCSDITKVIKDLYPEDAVLQGVAKQISKEIILTNLNVTWNDVKGLKEGKESIYDALVYPMKYPIFFREKFSPWKGILLYGPPGTGKTMLAKAVATECNYTFFNITASSLISKWRGDSEKYIRVLFDLAYAQSPTIIFIDEIDWIATSMEDDSLSEPARRFRAELLSRLDGILSSENSNVMVLAATNVPWNIDSALLRRLEKHIYVPIPDAETRHDILAHYVSSEMIETEEYNNLVAQMNGYSGAEIKLVCKQAWISQSKPTWQRIENKEIKVVDLGYHINDIGHLFAALRLIKPATKDIIQRYLDFHRTVIGNA
ncbi:katanin p60 ATPase-containing subunit A-like 2 [Andrena cerasifolii]|uniref:katanin p60 ATPase-containing subunit A-like 2 n=1 Tax=Andrena cerasifolii TaxID=2819439 RepID=UPI0040378DF8